MICTPKKGQVNKFSGVIEKLSRVAKGGGNLPVLNEQLKTLSAGLGSIFKVIAPSKLGVLSAFNKELQRVGIVKPQDIKKSTEVLRELLKTIGITIKGGIQEKPGIKNLGNKIISELNKGLKEGSKEKIEATMTTISSSWLPALYCVDSSLTIAFIHQPQEVTLPPSINKELGPAISE